MTTTVASTAVEPLWTADDVAAYLGVPKPTLYQWRYLGTGPQGAKIGRHLRYNPDVVRAWFQAQAEEPTNGQR